MSPRFLKLPDPRSLLPPPPHVVLKSKVEDDEQVLSVVTEEDEQGPGCKVAEEAITAYAHLNGLAKGWGGFGVLRQTRDGLLEGASMASWIGEDNLATGMTALANALPEVRDSEGAKRLLSANEGMIEEAWQLGVKCGRVRSAVIKAHKTLEMLRTGELRLEDLPSGE